MLNGNKVAGKDHGKKSILLRKKPQDIPGSHKIILFRLLKLT